jgi:outer membrane scaffolding protein for murein synthesis (MipA/OmpV family)
MSFRVAAGGRGHIQTLLCGPIGIAACLGVLFAGIGIADARELPLWEAGVGVFPSTFPAYRGSDDQQYYLLPIPYLMYHGDILRIDREGVRARLFDTDRIEVNVSVNGAIPVNSDESDARKDMMWIPSMQRRSAPHMKPPAVTAAPFCSGA